jgi:hypothetical protein
MSSISIVHPLFGWKSLVQPIRQLIVSLGETRCRLMHQKISHPVNGKYRCWVCLREFHTDW